jgi:hypothetical protein
MPCPANALVRAAPRKPPAPITATFMSSPFPLAYGSPDRLT